MTERKHIRAVEGEETERSALLTPAEATVEVERTEEFEHTEWFEEPEPRRSISWLVPALSVAAIAGWTGFFAWVHHAQMLAGASAEVWGGWITSWAIPVLLAVSLWMLAMRNSAREAARFGAVAQSLSAESALLEDRLVTVNRELSLAREFLATQSRELEFLGRSAGERLSEHADRLQSLVIGNGEQVEAIAGVSVTALENMDRLRDNLPVIANSARDVSNQIGSAGRTSQDQLGQLISGFERLNEFGAASERQVASLRKRVEEALNAFEAQADQLALIADQRFATLREDSDEFRGELDSREVEALAAIRGRAETLRAELAETHAAEAEQQEAALAALQARITALDEESTEVAGSIRKGQEVGLAAYSQQIDALQQRLREVVSELMQIDAQALDSSNEKLRTLFAEAERAEASIAERQASFDVDMAERRTAFDAAEQDAAQRLAARLADLDATIADRREDQLAQMTALAEEGEAVGNRIASLGQQFATVAEQGREARDVLSGGIDALSARLTDSREALDGTDMAVAALTDASVRLLELIQASAKQTREDLPKALDESETRLAAIEDRARDIKQLVDQAHASGEALTAELHAVDLSRTQANDGIEAFQARFGQTAAEQQEAIAALRTGVAALADESASVSERTQGELRDAITALETSARSALAAIEDDQAQRIAGIAEKVGQQSADAIDRALGERTEETLAKLDEATERSTQAARDTAIQLRDQLAKVNELAGNLEARVSQTRERAEEQVDNDFSRRVALITESLNSNAIDIAKALSTEVTDTAWAGYLRGDRGIFTRRAVDLVDNTQAREIAELYDADADFRSHVSRYIHDFEAMLRTMLSTRDGHAVSVTLLSSDMGKLYVLLAQALERLRQ
ncbi:ATPase [Qipengyuania marisflavi]|uniref:ATPase n=1 Tax=Qipengyuania marisflavi TaxID=2486356 RepID=A0A5S3P8Z5_9SPHN|nr:ATPase [Qipengyuania marisflavi]TMM49979.1 ATPase [Qipengyuania marisflavi]